MELISWIFILIFCSVLLGWAGYKSLSKYELLIANQPLDDNLSLYESVKQIWQNLFLRKLQLKRIQTNPTEEIPRSGIGFTNPEQTSQGENSSENPSISAITNISLSADIPSGVRVKIIIDASDFLPGESEQDILSIQSKGNKPIKIALLSKDSQAASPSSNFSGAASWEGRLAHAKQSVNSRFQTIPVDTLLFTLSIAIYLITRLIGLENFPIYFFTDEAVHTILAENLVNNNFHYNGVYLPTYFSLGASFGLNSTSVYLQIIPYLLFGKSIFVTRAVSVIISAFGAIAVGLILKDFFKTRYWWSGVLILSITPTWFLHSRTAFEYIELASFYAIFLYFYLCYRLRAPRYLFLAIIAGALVFYTHGLGQFLIASTTFLLTVVDLPYHWRQKKVILPGLLLIGFLALPYFRFTLDNAGIFADQLRMRDAYWFEKNLNLLDKLARFSKEYLNGLNPGYWFTSNNPNDLVRHKMSGYGHLWFFSLPFLFIGLWSIIKNFRSPAHRTILIAFLAAPFGAALAQITVLRVIWLVIPAAIATSLGLIKLLTWLENRRVPERVLAPGLFIILAGFNFFMLYDATQNGPTWYRDYSLYGMQYGAKQVFGEAIPEILQQSPDTRFVVTPTWANGTDNFVQFFLTPEQQAHVKLDSIQAFLFERLPLDENMLIVLTQPEYAEASSSPKFKTANPEKILYYPDGTPGFYFTNLEYSEQADQIFAAEKLARSQPVESQLLIDDILAKIRYSQIDMGQPENIFDGDTYTLMRGLEANPFLIELEFNEPQAIKKIIMDLANMDFTLTATLTGDDLSNPVVYQTTQSGVQGDPHVEMQLDRGPERVNKLRLEILSLNGGERPHIHIRELNLEP